MMIDIRKGFRQYSPAALREYSYNGLLTVGTFEVNDFIEYIFTGYSDDDLGINNVELHQGTFFVNGEVAIQGGMALSELIVKNERN